MITVRRNTERRHVQSGKSDIWLSFYPEDVAGGLSDGFGVLSFFNEMRLPPGEGFDSHPMNETELITYAYKGALAQEDSTGCSGVVHTCEFQRMTTGRVIRHKAMNASRTDWAHIFRIYLRPSEVGLDCTHEQKHFTAAERRKVLCAVASPDGRKGSLRIHQDTCIYSSMLDPGQHIVYELLQGRRAWLHIVYGEVTVNGIDLTQGDGVGIISEPSVSLTVRESTELLLVDTIPNFDKPVQLKEPI
jgi:redox-sensitive bicupin YhaK (pirin superfamily)